VRCRLTFPDGGFRVAVDLAGCLSRGCRLVRRTALSDSGQSARDEWKGQCCHERLIIAAVLLMESEWMLMLQEGDNSYLELSRDAKIPKHEMQR
jgi:hypothetical protein